MTWIEQDLRVLSRIHISRELRVFGVTFWTQSFVCVKNWHFATLLNHWWKFPPPKNSFWTAGQNFDFCWQNMTMCTNVKVSSFLVILSVPPYLMSNIRYWLTGACKYCPVSDIWSIYAPTRYEWAHFSAPAQFCLFSGRSLLFSIPPIPTICLQLHFNLDQQSLKAETFSIKEFYSGFSRHV